ncbi:MAG: hypothetical protein V4613_03930 [Bacteroidota bacterium]
MKKRYQSLNVVMIKSLLLLVMVHLTFIAKAQITNVNVSVNIIPPYSPYISDYINSQNKTMVTLMPNGSPSDVANVYFKASMIGDNGVSVMTKTGYKPAQPLQINGLIPKVLNGLQLQAYFDASNMIFTGVTFAELVYGNGLPEGSYTLCVQVFDFDTDLPLSQSSPLGCSAPIQIEHVDPPLPMSPQCGLQITQTPVQNVLFNWSYNPGFTQNLQYLLKIVPVLKQQNPNDAINTMVTPAFFEKIIKSTSYLYGPADPYLTPGTTYAYRIKVFDPTNKILFKNNGESEVCTFTYGFVDTTIGPPVASSSSKSVTLQGKVEYYFRETAMKKVLVALGGGKSKMENKLVTKKEFHPLANESLRLIKVTTLVPVIQVKKYDPVKKITITIDSIPTLYETPFIGWKPSPENAGAGTVVATAKTDEAGNYTFNFTRTDDPVLTDAEAGGKNELIAEDGQKMVFIRAYMIDAVNNYYGDPMGIINIEKGGKKAGVNVSVPVKQYTLKLKLKNYENQKEYYSGKSTPISGSYKSNVEIYLLRKYKSTTAPGYECGSLTGKALEQLYLTAEEGGVKNSKGEFTSYTVVFKKTVPMNDIVEIKNLVQNMYPGNDDYYVFARVPGTKIIYTPQKFVFNDCAFNDCTTNPDIMLWPLSNEVKVYDLEYGVFQSNMTIKGSLKYTFTDDGGSPMINNAKPLGNVKVNLVGAWVIKSYANGKTYEYVNGEIYSTTTTNSDGDFSFNNVGYVGLSQLGGQNLSWNKNKTQTVIDKNGNSISITGDVNYVLRLEVQSPYYYSPDNDFLVEPGYMYNMGNLYASVRECNPTVSKLVAYNPDIPSMANITQLPSKGGEKVYLLKKKSKVSSDFPIRPVNLSKDKIISPGGTEYVVLDEALTANDGTYSFSHIVLSDVNNNMDYYSLYSESPKTSIDNYKSAICDYVLVKDDLESKTFFNSTKYLKKYNTQQKITNPLIKQKLTSISQAPVINGAVYPESNMANNPLEGVTVQLYDLPSNFGGVGNNDPLDAFNFIKALAKLESTIITGENGKFEFSCNSSNGKSGKKVLYFYKPGFNVKVIFVNDGKKLIMGQRAPLNKVTLELPLQVNAKVKNSKGEFIDAKVVVGEDFSWAETKTTYTYKTEKKGDYSVVVPVPIGQELKLLVPSITVSIKVYPTDNNTYMPSEQVFTFTKTGPKTIELLAKERAHDITIHGYATVAGKQKGIPVKVEIINTNPKYTFKSQKFFNFTTGEVFDYTPVSFVNSATTFKAILSSDGYASKEVTLYSVAGKSKTLDYTFEKAIAVKGVVTMDNLPVKNAKVFIDGNDNIQEVLTDADGRFVLNGVPQNGKKVFINVTAPSWINAIGMSKEITPSATGTIALELKAFKAMDITKIHGFPMEVLSIRESGGAYLLNCRINITGKDNAVFAVDGGSYMKFYDLKVNPGNAKQNGTLPPAILVESFSSSGNLELPVKIYKTYLGAVERPNGVQLKKEDDNKASIAGYVSVDQQSFTKGVSFTGSCFYLSNPGYKRVGISESVKSEKLHVITSVESPSYSYLQNGFMISNKQFENVKCTLHNRYKGSELVSEKSKFNQYGIQAEGIVHTDIKQFAEPDIKLNIGQMYIDNDGPSMISANKELKIAMGKWSFVTTSYNFSSKGLVVNGNIMAGLFAVPTKDMLIDYDKLAYGSYNINQIKLGGYLPLNLTEENSVVSFGYDKGYGDNGSWSLTILPKGTEVLTSLKSLPNLASGDRIDLASVALFSTGDDALMISSQTPYVTLNGFAKYKPTMASVYMGGLKFRGPIDLQIPKCPQLAAYDLNYELKNGKLTHIHNIQFKDANYKPIVINTKGVVLSFYNENQVFADGKLVLKGKITDQDPSIKYSFEYTFTKGNNNGSLQLDEGKKQFYYMTGNTSQGLENIKGSMYVAGNNNEWNRFKFNGDMFGYNGISNEKRNVAFEVKGDLVANNTELGVKNMDAGGIGGMSITYDFKEQALIGSLHVDRDFGSYYLVSDLEMKVGGSGWYIFGAGEMEIKDMELPVKRVKAAFFVGNNTMSPKQIAIFTTFFYKNELPTNFPKGLIKGAVFGAAVSFPIPKVPQIDIPLSPVVHIVLEHQINVNGFFAVNFDGDPTLSAGVQAYVYVHLGAGMSVGLACAGADFKITTGAKGEATIKKSLDFSLKAVAFLSITGSAYVGIGGCEDDCSDLCWCLPGCYTTSWSKTVGMDFEININRVNGKSGFDIGFKNVQL